MVKNIVGKKSIKVFSKIHKYVIGLDKTNFTWPAMFTPSWNSTKYWEETANQSIFTASAANKIENLKIYALFLFLNSLAGTVKMSRINKKYTILHIVITIRHTESSAK